MVRLETAAGDDDLGLPRQRVGEEELELSELVARLGTAGRVVALDPHPGSDEVVEPRPALDRRRPVHEEESLRCRHVSLSPERTACSRPPPRHLRRRALDDLAGGFRLDLVLHLHRLDHA